MSRQRLDGELVKRKLAKSRQEAQDLIQNKQVYVNEFLAIKPATNVDSETKIVVKEVGKRWASRGAHKLLGAIAEFQSLGLNISGKKCLDAGASHGGFTDVLLDNDAQEVICVDVGYGQLDWRLRSDSRVKIFDRTNVRYISDETIGTKVDLIVSDLSFISLTTVIPAFIKCSYVGTQAMLMVKPQFEVGKSLVGKNGVVKDPEARIDAVLFVAKFALSNGYLLKGIAPSPLPGPSGNREYFLWLEFVGFSTIDTIQEDDLRALILEVVKRETIDE